MRAIEIRVEPNGSSMKYYCIYYRDKKRFNFFNYWKQLVEVWDGAELTYDQPILIADFNQAVSYAKRLKANPKLIDEHYEKEDKKYNQIKERRNQHYQERNKSAQI